MSSQQKPVNSSNHLEGFAKTTLIILYTVLWIFTIYLYFTFTPIEHSFITRTWIEEKHKNGVIIRREEWKFNLNGVEVPTKLSIKGE